MCFVRIYTATVEVRQRTMRWQLIFPVGPTVAGYDYLQICATINSIFLDMAPVPILHGPNSHTDAAASFPTMSKDNNHG